MAIRSNKALMAGLDMMQGRAVRGIGREYRERVMGPLVEALRDADGYEALRHRLQTGATLGRMDESVVADALTSTGVQAQLIARVAARPARQQGNEARRQRGEA